MNHNLTEIIEKHILGTYLLLAVEKEQKPNDFSHKQAMTKERAIINDLTEEVIGNFFTQLKDIHTTIPSKPSEINRDWNILVTGDLLRWIETSLDFKPNHTPTTQRLMRGDMGYSAAIINISGFDVVQLVDRIKAYAEAQLKHKAEEQAKKDQETVNKLILEHLPKLMECMSNQEQRLSEMQKAHGEEMVALHEKLNSLTKQNEVLQEKLNNLCKKSKS